MSGIRLKELLNCLKQSKRRMAFKTSSFTAGKTIPEKCCGQHSNASVARQEGPRWTFVLFGEHRADHYCKMFAVTEASIITNNKTWQEETDPVRSLWLTLNDSKCLWRFECSALEPQATVRFLTSQEAAGHTKAQFARGRSSIQAPPEHTLQPLFTLV